MSLLNYFKMIFIVSSCTQLVFTSVFSNAYASTFVGNGGNAGDLELQVTLAQIKKSFLEIKTGEYKKNQVCAYDNELQGHKIGETLKSLSLEQVHFCENIILKKTPEYLDLLSGPQSLQIQWTSDSIQVDEIFGFREANAVAIHAERKIFLNREQFLALRDYERIFLLTHELGHLVKIKDQLNDNAFLKDDEPIGPYKQNDGGRQLLNSIGAAITMKSLTNGVIDDYSKSLKRSKNYKQNWMSLSVINDVSHKDESTFSIKNYSGLQASYQFQINHEFGIGIKNQYLKGNETFLDTIKSENEIKLWSLFFNYRLFPFSNPLSFGGQSFINLAVGYQKGTAHMKIYDNYTSKTEEAELSAPFASIQYYMPLFFGFWINPGIELSTYQYEFKQIGFKSDSNQVHFHLGVSYAF